ncbi:glyoxalase, partial [Streptomyces sp. WM4235]
MSVELNHTIVHSRDNRRSAEYLADILGLEVGTEWGPFIPVETGNGVTLDFATAA